MALTTARAPEPRKRRAPLIRRSQPYIAKGSRIALSGSRGSCWPKSNTASSPLKERCGIPTEVSCVRSRSVHQSELKDIDSRANKIAKQRKPRDPAHVSDELNFLDAHRGDARGRSDDQVAA